MQRIFVTGATGFIGSHFVNAAVAAGLKITALRRPGSSPAVLVPQTPFLTWLEGDLKSVTSDELRDHDVLVHLAAVGVNPKQATWDTCFEVNTRQSIELWQNAIKANAQHFVICGSCFEYGLAGQRYDFIPYDASLEPVDPYDASKAAASMAAYALAIEGKVRVTKLGPLHVLGEGEGLDRFWPSLRVAAMAEDDFPV